MFLKTVIHTPDRVEMDSIPTPRDFYELHKFVNLTTDVIFLNGISFVNILSRKIRWITIEHIPTFAYAQLSSSLTKIVNIYTGGGFNVR